MRTRSPWLLLVVAIAAHGQRSSHGVTIGGPGTNSIGAVAVDGAGNVFVTGTTTSFAFPLRNAIQETNSGTELIYSTDAGANWAPLGNPVTVTRLTPLLVTVDPTNSQIVYAAAGSAVCKSMDGGRDFQCVTIGLGTVQTTLTSLIVDPRQPLTLYASATTNGGVYKSTDGGQTWKNASAGLPSGFISSVVEDPFHSGVLWAWAGNGGYVSTDGATTWKQSNMPWPQNSSVSGMGSPVIAFDPVTPGIIYGPQFVEGNLGPTGIEKSTDGGATWTILKFPFGACCVLPDPKVSGTLYAAGIANNQPPVYFWKSTDGGVTWTSVALPAGASSTLAVDPANSSIMMAGEFRSADGGKTWQPTNASRAITPTFSPSSPGVVYAAAPITSDAFVAKYLPDGRTLVFSTYFGGMGNDVGQGIALDAAGNIWVVGSTTSSDLPVTSAAFQGKLNGTGNAFIAKFSGDGKLLASTYLGGSGGDSGLGIALTAQGNPWVIVNSTSPDFPQTGTPVAAGPAAELGFVAELDASAARLLYSGAASGLFDAGGKGIAVDAAGEVIVTGYVNSAFSVTPGAFQSGAAGQYDPKAFVTKLSAAGQTIYSTYFGGSHAGYNPDGFEDEHDYGTAAAADAAGNAYIAGSTSASDFPTTAGSYQAALRGGCTYPAFSVDTGMIGTISNFEIDDVFVVKLSADGKQLLASTLLGGSCYDRATAIALTASGSVYVAGETDSMDFPLVSAVQNPPGKGAYASFVAAFDAGLSMLQFSTYLYAGSGPALAGGPGGSMYVAGATGPGAQTSSYSSFVDPFPTVATEGYWEKLETRATVRPRH